MKTFALAGNPNCGKTTLFNALTGATAHVGNWPGVTVDKREGVYKGGGKNINIVDLPGIYSLSVKRKGNKTAYGKGRFNAVGEKGRDRYKRKVCQTA